MNDILTFGNKTNFSFCVTSTRYKTAFNQTKCVIKSSRDYWQTASTVQTNVFRE